VAAARPGIWDRLPIPLAACSMRVPVRSIACGCHVRARHCLSCGALPRRRLAAPLILLRRRKFKSVREWMVEAGVRQEFLGINLNRVWHDPSDWSASVVIHIETTEAKPSSTGKAVCSSFSASITVRCGFQIQMICRPGAQRCPVRLALAAILAGRQLPPAGKQMRESGVARSYEAGVPATTRARALTVPQFLERAAGVRRCDRHHLLQSPPHLSGAPGARRPIRNRPHEAGRRCDSRVAIQLPKHSADVIALLRDTCPRAHVVMTNPLYTRASSRHQGAMRCRVAVVDGFPVCEPDRAGPRTAAIEHTSSLDPRLHTAAAGFRGGWKLSRAIRPCE